MRPPEPRSLLVEHPALPQPFELHETKDQTVAIETLDRADRVRVAVQLVALAALLGDFELWPGRWAIRRAGVFYTEEGPRAVLPVVPISLSRLWARLGGGNGAAELTRNGVLSTILELTALEPELFRPGGREPGFILEGVLERLLHLLPRPLDPPTARSLWMLRWSLPPAPERGDTSLLAIPDDAVARRLAAAMWAAAVRKGHGGSLEFATPGKAPVLVGERSGECLLRVIAGEFDQELLGAMGEQNGFGATVVIGRFPDGWNPPRAQVFDEARFAGHLAVVGIPPARRVRWLNDRSGRFDPYSALDRRMMTRSASRLFSKPPGYRRDRFREIIRVASLVPEGLEVSRALDLAGVDDAELAAAKAAGAVLVRNDRVMLPSQAGLGVDPLHGEVLDLFAGDDPRRLLHAALTTGDTGEILPWARRELNSLASRGVRRVLSEIAPGALGPGVQVALAEACLSLADIHGAEAALGGLAPEIKQPWVNWLNVIDRSADLELDFPLRTEFRQAPRACAEVALVCVRRAMERGLKDASGMVASVREAMALLDGALRSRIEIRLAALVEPDKLGDGRWRRRTVGSHPELVGLVLFERSIRAHKDGHSELARRLLKRLIAVERSPGRLAPMHVNLGALAFDDGRDKTAEAHTLRALRFFQAAGFRRRTWEVLYNLAVTDIDHLRVSKAAARLDVVSEGSDGLYVAVERARLALAVGDLDGFATMLSELPGLEGLGDPRLLSALSFLHGVERLLFDSPQAAESLLLDGDPEALGWLDLAAAVKGDPTPRSVIEKGGEDLWGIRRAAELVRQSRQPGFDLVQDALSSSTLDLTDAVAVAVFRFLAVRRDWPDRHLRARVTGVLARGGLSGWAARVRWEGWEIEEVLRAVEAVVQGKGSDELTEVQTANLLGLLGVDGVVVRSRVDGNELWRIGEGEALPGRARGRLEFCPLGTEPVDGVGWDLMAGVLELVLPVGGQRPRPRNDGDVRLDGESAALEKLREEIRQVAATLYTVLVHGETGAGKEVVAREIHRLSGRSGELVSVNIAAVPVNLIEAELFGSVKGAFTGADRSRRGLVAAADGGTLFLDEVGDLDPALQVKVLRFLESGEVRPVGSDRTSTVDVRVICATHRNLERLVRERKFRQDLYFRIALGKVILPALRSRPEDISTLKAIFEREASERHGLPISVWSRAADDLLLNHRWPGNVRELKRTVEVAMARAAGRTIRPEHLPIVEDPIIQRGTWNETLAQFKSRLLAEVLTRHRGNRSAAARELGISRQALLYQLKTLGLREL